MVRAPSIEDRVLRVDVQHAATWDGSGDAGVRFVSPSGIAVDRTGNIYVAENGSRLIRVLDSNGILLTRWPRLPPDVMITTPVDIDVDSSGNTG